MAEDDSEMRHRRLDELLTEIRVLLPGVQVLFAFLLSLPFLNSFHSITGPQRIVYYVTFLSTMIAMVLLIVPPAFHRQAFRQRQKVLVVETGSRLLLSALAMLGLSVVGVVYLVSDVLFRWPVAVVVAAGTAALLLGAWYWYPRRRREDA